MAARKKLAKQISSYINLLLGYSPDAKKKN